MTITKITFTATGAGLAGAYRGLHSHYAVGTTDTSLETLDTLVLPRHYLISPRNEIPGGERRVLTVPGRPFVQATVIRAMTDGFVSCYVDGFDDQEVKSLQTRIMSSLDLRPREPSRRERIRFRQGFLQQAERYSAMTAIAALRGERMPDIYESVHTTLAFMGQEFLLGNTAA